VYHIPKFLIPTGYGFGIMQAEILMEVSFLTQLREGLVIKAISGFYTVETEQEMIVSQLPGRLKQEWQSSSIVAVGDYVTISLNDDGTGTIEEIAPRRTVLSRTRPTAEARRLNSDREQVLVANLDQLILVFAAKNPHPSLRKIDRFLVVAEMNELPTIICINKVDLVDLEKTRQKFQLYTDIGYHVIYTSVTENIGIDELHHCLHNKISVFAGSSGVGKSSLLNAIEPDLGLKVNQVSQATGKGLHTTRYAELIPLEDGGYVADTPGIRGLALFDVEPSELDAYFREIAPLVSDCQFSDCSHRHEPKCAVRAAVDDGEISQKRYESYLRLLEEHEMLDKTAY
jgi:ribosome biogenesis GTPase